jgi:hypothetical protein
VMWIVLPRSSSPCDKKSPTGSRLQLYATTASAAAVAGWRWTVCAIPILFLRVIVKRGTFGGLVRRGGLLFAKMSQAWVVCDTTMARVSG